MAHTFSLAYGRSKVDSQNVNGGRKRAPGRWTLHVFNEICWHEPSFSVHLDSSVHSNQTSSPNFKQSHWYSWQYIHSVNHKHFRDSIGLYLEIQTPAHKSHLCKCFTRAKCVFYVFFMSVERPHLEWHSLPEQLGKKIQKTFYRLIFYNICSLYT